MVQHVGGGVLTLEQYSGYIYCLSIRSRALGSIGEAEIRCLVFSVKAFVLNYELPEVRRWLP